MVLSFYQEHVRKTTGISAPQKLITIPILFIIIIITFHEQPGSWQWWCISAFFPEFFVEKKAVYHPRKDGNCPPGQAETWQWCIHWDSMQRGECALKAVSHLDQAVTCFWSCQKTKLPGKESLHWSCFDSEEGKWGWAYSFYFPTSGTGNGYLNFNGGIESHLFVKRIQE